uniref:Uncharacterized protein n=1 Tax=Siphoviridae sp. ctOow3 TaxID=2826315 RepID=A0A8S5R0G1_9CAUD|nr:MAG TPA: hypothetical protein [Siphoviridae sp. ctOow3]
MKKWRNHWWRDFIKALKVKFEISPFYIVQTVLKTLKVA